MIQDVLRHAVPDALYDASSEGARLLRASLAGCSTRARTRLAMNLALRTGSPVRVTSATSTMPRPVVISTRRPARVATISYVREPSSAATTTSTRSPFMARAYSGFADGRSACGRYPEDTVIAARGAHCGVRRLRPTTERWTDDVAWKRAPLRDQACSWLCRAGIARWRSCRLVSCRHDVAFVRTASESASCASRRHPQRFRRPEASCASEPSCTARGSVASRRQGP